MRVLKVSLLFVALAVLGCGGGSPPKKTAKKTESEPVATDLAKTGESEKTETEAKTEGEAKTAAEAKTPAAKTVAAAKTEAPAAKTGELDIPIPNVTSDIPLPSGKGVGQLIKELWSPEKDKIIEACEEIRISSSVPELKAAKPKLEQLAKSADAEIKESAEGALKALK
ncbi:MAG: hypothetical protein M5U26_01975 [Planctomycetota bacterium]|nr:hypothetical protein [Planctomycetota bacterium]